jgi:hypothetical protein
MPEIFIRLWIFFAVIAMASTLQGCAAKALVDLYRCGGSNACN